LFLKNILGKIDNTLTDVVKNWMRNRSTIEFLGLWEKLHNPAFKGVEIDPFLFEAGSNAFTMSPTKWKVLMLYLFVRGFHNLNALFS